MMRAARGFALTLARLKSATKAFSNLAKPAVAVRPCNRRLLFSAPAIPMRRSIRNRRYATWKERLPLDAGVVQVPLRFVDDIASVMLWLLPEHKEHEMYRDWIGPFDPKAFDAAEATDSMREGLPDWRE